MVRVAPIATTVRAAPADAGLRGADEKEVLREANLVTKPSRFEFPRVEAAPNGTAATKRSRLDLAGRVFPYGFAAATTSRLELTDGDGFPFSLVAGGSADDTALASSVTGRREFSPRFPVADDGVLSSLRPTAESDDDGVVVGANLSAPFCAVARRGAAAAAAAATAATARALLPTGADAGRVFLEPF